MDTKDKAIAAFKKGKISMWDINAYDKNKYRYMPNYCYKSEVGENLYLYFEGYRMYLRETKKPEELSPLRDNIEYREHARINLSYNEAKELADYGTIQSRANEIQTTPEAEKILNDFLEIPA